jgi:polysaccharide chain length determinant protein (PEP-CTERM system associated)
MLNIEKSFNIHNYIEILLKRIWFVIIPLAAILMGAIIYAYTSPKLYRASTLILVTPQKVPSDYVRTTVTSGIGERLQSIGQELMSRTRLEQMISEFKLYQEEAKSLSPEEVVELMKKNIQIEIRGREGYFTVSYIGKDPRVVTMVTNKLTSLFIEENLKFREQQAQGTTEFLAIELNATRGKLEEQEKVVTQFKKQFMSELPENREANLKVLDQLQLQYQRGNDNLRAAQDRKLIIQKQLNELKLQTPLTTSPETLKGEEVSITNPLLQPPLKPKMKNSYELQLDQLRNHLSGLQTKYKEKHPDILMVKKQIADLENQIEKIKASEAEEEKLRVEKVEEKAILSPSLMVSTPETLKKEKGEGKGDLEFNPFYKEMESQLIATELEIKRLKDEEPNLKVKIAEFQMRVENAPARGLAITSLTRDYQNISDTYHSLVRKNMEAQTGENLERRQKGEQFKVIDPARIPEKPFKPNIPRILLFGFLLGMGSGFGIAFLREQMDRSFKDADDLETTLGFKVLANIPKIEKKAA